MHACILVLSWNSLIMTLYGIINVLSAITFFIHVCPTGMHLSGSSLSYTEIQLLQFVEFCPAYK